MITIHHIGTTLNRPDWPQAGTLEGLFQALENWDLDRRLDHSTDPRLDPHPLRAPFRGPALMLGGTEWDPELSCTRYHYGAPAYPEHPQAVTYNGNFVGYSFGFSVTTDDPDLIQRLDAAIAKNVERQRMADELILNGRRPQEFASTQETTRERMRA